MGLLSNFGWAATVAVCHESDYIIITTTTSKKAVNCPILVLRSLRSQSNDNDDKTNINNKRDKCSVSTSLCITIYSFTEANDQSLRPGISPL